MSIENPQNKGEFIEHCLMLLGQPVIKINVTKEQCALVTKQAVAKFVNYSYLGTEMAWIKHEIDENFMRDKYLIVPDAAIEVTDVMGVDSSKYGVLNRQAGFELLFNTSDQVIDPINANVEIYLFQQKMSELRNILSPPEKYHFSPITRRLYINANDWDITIGAFIVYEAAMSLESFGKDFWSSDWLIRYGTALIKKQWGNNMSKFSEIELPGGYKISGADIRTDAKDDLVLLLEELNEQSVAQAQITIG